MRIAIDGPAGSGKSTVARALAERCGLTYLDTGAMYRSVTEACLSRGVDVGDADAVAEVARQIRIEFGRADDGSQTVTVDGEDYTTRIRMPEVDRNVSAVSAIPTVREAMVEQQRAIGEAGDVVAEGRDIGTVVFPAAEVKVFLTADASARAHRRAVQREGGDAAKDPAAMADASEERAILADLERRDRLDSTREVAPLKAADDAVVIDSSELGVNEVVERIVGLMERARATQAKVQKGASPVEVAEKPQSQSQVQPEGPEADGSEAKAQPEPSTEPAAAAALGTKPAAKPGNQPASEAKPEPKAEPEPKPESKTRPSKRVDAKTEAKDGERLKAFRHNTFEDYYDHGMLEYPRPGKLLMGLVVGVVGGLSKVLWPWHVETPEALWHTDDKHGRVIVMNHTSMLDPVIVIATEYTHGRRVRSIYKSEFDKLKPATWLFSRAGAIPVDRGTADIKAVRRAQHALQRGEDVLIYPEGTRIKSDDEEVTLHAGFALMAQLGRADVLPMAIVGARDITTRTRKVPHFHRVYCKVGEPITFASLGVKGRKKQATAMEKAAMDEVYRLRDELRREHPGKE